MALDYFEPTKQADDMIDGKMPDDQTAALSPDQVAPDPAPSQAAGLAAMYKSEVEPAMAAHKSALEKLQSAHQTKPSSDENSNAMWTSVSKALSEYGKGFAQPRGGSLGQIIAMAGGAYGDELQRQFQAQREGNVKASDLEFQDAGKRLTAVQQKYITALGQANKAASSTNRWMRVNKDTVFDRMTGTQKPIDKTAQQIHDEAFNRLFKVAMTQDPSSAYELAKVQADAEMQMYYDKKFANTVVNSGNALVNPKDAVVNSGNALVNQPTSMPTAIEDTEHLPTGAPDNRARPPLQNRSSGKVPDTGRPADFPVVTPGQQASRDADRKAIIDQELSNIKKILDKNPNDQDALNYRAQLWKEQASKGVMPRNVDTTAARAASKTAAVRNVQLGDPESIKRLAESIASGNEDPLSGRVAASPYGQSVRDEVLKINPLFDARSTRADNKTLAAFASGNPGSPGGSIKSFNTALYHLDTMQEVSDALKNNDIKLANKIVNAYKNETGNEVVPEFNAVKNIVSTEIVKAISGSAGALADREELRKDIDSANSPAALNGVIKKYKELMSGQLRGYETQYASTGKSNFRDKFLSPNSIEAMKSIPAAKPYKQSENQPSQKPTAQDLVSQFKEKLNKEKLKGNSK